MIKCKDAKVEIEVTGGELMQTMIDHEVTADTAMLACVGCDLTYIFNELVKIYGIKTALTLWAGAFSAYHHVIEKGENET